jgi:hypothetical protein
VWRVFESLERRCAVYVLSYKNISYHARKSTQNQQHFKLPFKWCLQQWRQCGCKKYEFYVLFIQLDLIVFWVLALLMLIECIICVQNVSSFFLWARQLYCLERMSPFRNISWQLQCLAKRHEKRCATLILNGEPHWSLSELDDRRMWKKNAAVHGSMCVQCGDNFVSHS